MLIGPPGSGKSTLAQQMQQILEPSCIVSTDRIRQDLYGDEATQGPWPEIEAVVLHQMHEALVQGKCIIYDATNAKRVWRMGLFQALNRPEIAWVGWQLTTSVATCVQWNRLRDRTVPETVIADMGKPSSNFPPSLPKALSPFIPSILAREPTPSRPASPPCIAASSTAVTAPTMPISNAIDIPDYWPSIACSI
jgi:predicted kinase